MTERIGVMGGMFDPVHRGHVAAARAALEQLGLTRIHMVPCASPNHRGPASATGEQRMQMLSLAIAGDERLLVDDRELRRSGKSYAVDTLKSIHEDYPNASLVFVLGWDSFLSLPRWHQWQSLFEHAHLCAVSRPGVAWPPAGSPDSETLQALLEQRQVETPEALFSEQQGAVYVLEGVENDVSSTALREALRSRQTTRDWLEPAVTEYIDAHALY